MDVSEVTRVDIWFELAQDSVQSWIQRSLIYGLYYKRTVTQRFFTWLAIKVFSRLLSQEIRSLVADEIALF